MGYYTKDDLENILGCPIQVLEDDDTCSTSELVMLAQVGDGWVPGDPELLAILADEARGGSSAAGGSLLGSIAMLAFIVLIVYLTICGL